MISMHKIYSANVNCGLFYISILVCNFSSNIYTSIILLYDYASVKVYSIFPKQKKSTNTILRKKKQRVQIAECVNSRKKDIILSAVGSDDESFIVDFQG